MAAVLAICAPVFIGSSMDKTEQSDEIKTALTHQCYPPQISDEIRVENGMPPLHVAKPEKQIDWSSEKQKNIMKLYGFTEADVTPEAIAKSKAAQAAIVEGYRHKIPVRQVEKDNYGNASILCRSATIKYNLDHRTFSERLSGLITDPGNELTGFTNRHMMTLLGAGFSIFLFTTYFVSSRFKNAFRWIIREIHALTAPR